MPTVEEQLRSVVNTVNTVNKSVSDLQHELAQVRDQQSSAMRGLEGSVGTAASRIESFLGRLKKVEDALATIKRESESGAKPATRPGITFDEFARQLRVSVEGFNNEAKAGASQLVIEALEVELKTAVDVSEKVKLSPMLPQELKPEGLSALRFTLRPITKLKFSD